MLLEIDRNCNARIPALSASKAASRLRRARRIAARLPGSGRMARARALYISISMTTSSVCNTTNAIQSVIQYFRQSKASTIEVTAYRGSSKLTDGTVMVEQEGIAGARATKVHDILVGLGVPETAVRVQLTTRVREPDGIDDPWSRKLTLSVKH